jgi:hypothetical protein
MLAQMFPPWMVCLDVTHTMLKHCVGGGNGCQQPKVTVCRGSRRDANHHFAQLRLQPMQLSVLETREYRDQSECVLFGATAQPVPWLSILPPCEAEF